MALIDFIQELDFIACYCMDNRLGYPWLKINVRSDLRDDVGIVPYRFINLFYDLYDKLRRGGGDSSMLLKRRWGSPPVFSMKFSKKWLQLHKTLFLSMICLPVFLLANIISCADASGIYPDNGKINIIASLFPQYDFARQIAGDRANIVLLLPPGTESHMFDPKPSDMANIYNADLFLYTGEHMEPWADEIIGSVPESSNVTAVDCSAGVELIYAGEDEESGEHGEHIDHDHALDPHIWLNPVMAIQMVDNILDNLCRIDGGNAEYYTYNAENYKAELRKLDEDIFSAIENAQRNVLVFGGRFAYIYFVRHFNLNYVSVYDSCSTNAEPSVRAVADVTDFIVNNNIPCIYHEEFADAKVANAIAESTNISCELFSTVHNVTKSDFDDGVTFVDVMYSNLENIKKGLN